MFKEFKKMRTILRTDYVNGVMLRSEADGYLIIIQYSNGVRYSKEFKSELDAKEAFDEISEVLGAKE